MSARIYGIRNCDTMKKAFRWLEDRGIDFSFHDYKKDGVPEDVIGRALKAHGWQDVLNRGGTTWRKLPESVRDTMDDGMAMRVALENPSVIRRPLLVHDGKIYLGFKDALYRDIFS